MEEVTNGVADLATTDNGQEDAFTSIAAASKATEEAAAAAVTPLDAPFKLHVDESTDAGKLNLALIAGDIELAVDICIEQNRCACSV